MVFKEREDLYLALSRKELQGLCRRHGLPSTNRTKGCLAKSLVDYFNRGRSWPEAMGRRKRGRPPLRDRAEEVAVDGGASRMCGKEKLKFCKDINVADDHVVSVQQPCFGRESMDFRENCHDRLTMGNMFMNWPTVYRGNANTNEISTGSGLASLREIFADVPASFQFFVRADEGISLCVDLDSSPSNWVKTLNDEVSINQISRRDCSWIISNELKETGIKSLEMFPEENIDTFDNIGEPLSKVVDENNDTSKSSMTSMVEDKSAESVEFPNESNQPSSSCAISSGVECGNDSGDVHCSVPEHASTQNVGTDSTINDNLLSSGSSLNQNIRDHALPEVQNLLDDPILDKDSSHQNAESDSLGKCLVSVSDVGDEVPMICFDGVIQNGEDIQVDSENGSSCELLQEDTVAEKSVTENQQPAEQVTSDSCTDMVQCDRGSRDDLTQEHRGNSLASSVSKDMTTVQREELCNKSDAKEKVSSGGNILTGKFCKRLSKSVMPESRRQFTFAEGSVRSMINLRSRKTVAKGPVYGRSAFTGRSMRLISK